MVMFLGVVFNSVGEKVAEILGCFLTRTTSLQLSFPVIRSVFSKLADFEM